MAILSESLLEHIDIAKERLDESKLDIFIKSMFNNLVNETMLYAPIQDADNEARKDEVIKNFKAAWKKGLTKYQGKFDLILLTDICGQVEPSLRVSGQNYAHYRKSSARMEGINYIPPIDEERIMSSLEQVLTVIEDEEMHPVEEAIFTYFHLVRIQTFDNANKRTAHIMMNLKLNQDNFPTIYITPSEKNTFISLFRSAIDGFRDSSSNGQVIRAYTSPDYLQQGFYDFLGNKILDNLKMAEDQLKNLGRYHIIFNSIQSPGSMYTAKQKVSSWFNSRKQIFQMNLKPRERTLEIIGNIPYEVVNDILGTLKKTKYTLSTTD